MTDLPDLTPRQAAFVAEYLVDLNATQAAIRAGYSASGARVQGTRLLANVAVRAAIAEGADARLAASGVTAERVLQEYARIAYVDPGDVMEWGVKEIAIGFDADGKKLPPDQIGDAAVIHYEQANYLTPKNSRDLPAHVRAAVSEVSIGKDGNMRVKLHSKGDALNGLGRYLALFTDKVEQSGSVNVIVQRFSDEDEGV